MFLEWTDLNMNIIQYNEGGSNANRKKKLENITVKAPYSINIILWQYEILRVAVLIDGCHDGGRVARMCQTESMTKFVHSHQK